MKNRFFGERGSRKRNIWIGVSIFITLMIVYQVGYSAGVRSMSETVERLGAVPQNRPVALTPHDISATLPENSQTSVSLPRVPSFSRALDGPGNILRAR